MSTSEPLAAWDAAVKAYLTSRHAIGRLYAKEEYFLDDLRAFLVDINAVDLNRPLFDQWRGRASHLSANTRIVRDYTVYNFCRYRRRREPDCYLPDPGGLTRPGPRPLPTIVERNQVTQLLEYLSTMEPPANAPLRPVVLRMAVLLLYTTGLRRGELVRLTLADTDPVQGTLFIRESKHHRSRWVPLSQSMCEELREYLELRRRAGIDCRDRAPLIVTVRGDAYTLGGFYRAIKTVLLTAGICDSNGHCPCLQDFRHSFAVGALLRWYEEGADVQVNLPKLALYMGHVSIVSTAYYLRCMPNVLAHASQRFENSYATLLEGDLP